MATVISQFNASRLSTGVGETVYITAGFSDTVTLNASGGSAPFLALSNGANAQLDVARSALAGDNELVFAYTVRPNDFSITGLTVNGLFLDGASLRDSAGAAVVTKVTSGVNESIYVSGNNEVAIVSQTITSDDLVSPRVASVDVVSGNYLPGDKVTLTVVFDEAVGVTPGAKLPTLTLMSNGEVLDDVIASYASGSGTKKLNFTFTVTDTMDVADLQLGELLANGSFLADASGNAAILSLPELPSATSVSLGDQTVYVEEEVNLADVKIESIRYLDNDTEAFKVGEVLSFSVRMTGVVNVDVSEGVPTLVLSNGGFARYTGGSDTNTLTFSYIVGASDRNTSDLRVLGLAENDAVFNGSLGQDVDVRITAANNLSTFNDVAINAQSPFITRIDSASQVVSLGESVEFIVNFSEAVDLEGDAPSLSLSNGATAEYVSGAPSKQLLFRYTAQEGDANAADLDVVSFDAPNSTLISLSGTGEASVSLSQITSVAAKYNITFDGERPEGTITFDSDALIAGETSGVTVTFAESVTNPRDAISVSNGTLSPLVPVEGTDIPRTVWKGVFTPTLKIEADETTLVLDNSLVTDNAGNTGTGLSVSNPISIDTLGPVAQMSSTVLYNGNRLITIDFGEQVTDFDVNDIVVTNGIKVTSGFTEVQAGQVYTLEVAPTAAAQDNPTGDVTVTLRKGTMTDSLGNLNAEQSIARPWDIRAPEITEINAVSGSYTAGDTIAIAVTYDEIVNVNAVNGTPFLALNNGQVAEYVRGSESNTLVFEYTVVQNDQVEALNVQALVKDGASITDNAGNDAKTYITPGANLSNNAIVEIDGVAPTIVTIEAAEDALYLAGDSVELTVQFSENVYIDFTNGSPILALSNGAVAEYVDGDGSSFLNFRYTVEPNDFDTTDLDVHALITNGSVFKDISGNEANVAILTQNSRLAYRSDVAVDAATPYINTISANAGHYKAGETIDIALGWNKPVEMNDALGTPELKLSNGEIATYNAAASTPTRLVFSYAVKATDFESDALSIAQLRTNYATFNGVVAGESADLTLPNGGAIAQANGGIFIDLTLPEVTHISVLDEDGSADLSAGEAATLTIEFNGAVKELRPEFFNLQNGTLSNLRSEDGVTWTGTFKPLKNTQAGEQALSLDLTKVSDLAGNFGLGQSQEANYTLDSAYPTVTIRSDADGIVNGEVRMVVNFSESVRDFDLTKLSVQGGTIDPMSLETPDNSGRPEGEYSFVVKPIRNSTQPIKVRVMDGVVTDEAGNPNKASDVLLQPVDTMKAKIEGIHAEAGAYAVGDTVQLTVKFTEEVALEDRPDDPDSPRLPTLFLNNGELATYVSGSGSDEWVFEYTYSADHAEGHPLQVITFLENDKLVVDDAGNRANTILGSNNRLQESVVVDGTEPVVLGFSSVEATYNSTEASLNGMYNTGDVIWIKLTASEWLNVDTTEGRPTLLLGNGGTATYVSGTGSNTLLFRYDVQDDDLSTDSLTVASVSFNDGLITDAAGNALVADSFNNAIVAGHVKPEVEVDTDAPIVETVSIVETVATNDTGATVDVTNDGYYSAGMTIAFEVKFDDVINVDTTEAIDGGPVLALSNGRLATYVEGDGTDTLRFEYTVSADDINTTDLEVLGLAEQGAVLTDDAGNPALVEMVTDRRNYTTAVVDTQGPESVGTSDSFSENADGEDIVRTLETLSYTFEFNEMMDLLLAAVPGVDPSIDPTDTATIEQIVADNQAEILSYFNVTLSSVDEDIHVRVDADGDLLTDVNDGLVATNFRFESNEDGTLDLTKFTVDVTTPDRTYADLHVGLNTEKFVDFAQNEPMDATIVATQRVDTQSFDLTAIPVAGLFITDTSTVRVLDANGDELVASIVLNPETGQASVRISPNEAYPGGYRGPVLVEVIDSDSAADYIDEFTGQGVSLAQEGETVVMRAMFNIVEPGEVTVTVSPVTELAVKKLQETMALESVSTFDAAKVDEYNKGIGRIFGIDDIIKTAATVVNSATVEAQTGADVTDFDATDGIDASEKYGQVLAMLSARDSATGSLISTITDIASDIKVASLGNSTAIAITQKGADKLANTLKAIETAANAADPEASDQSTQLDNAGVNTGLIEVSYIESAADTSYGINLEEARETRVPVKGAAEGDTVFVQWGVNTATGQPNIIEYVVTADDVAENGTVTVPVSIDAIALQMDSKEVPIRTAVIKPDAVDTEGNPVTEPSESDFTAPVLLQVDIIPPETTVEAPTAETPFEVSGAIEGLNAGDDFFILINNSADERYKYKVESTFLGDEDAELPAGLSLENIVYDAIGDTWAFDWTFDLTQAISVAELAAAEADPDYTPVPTFSEESEAAVFQVDAATSDIVGNAAEDNSRNEFIIGTASNLIESEEEKGFMDEVLNRLTERYDDAAVDTRSEIQTIANAVSNLEALSAFDSLALDGSLVSEQQTLILSANGSLPQAVFELTLGGDALTVNLEAVSSPTVADIVDAIRAESGYADKNYTVALSDDGNSVEISYKAFGPQPESSAISTLTETVSATQIDSTIDVAGDIANFAVQSIAVDGAAVENGFAVSPGQIRLSFGDVDLDLTAAEGDLITDLLADAQADAAYADLPFTLAVSDAGDSLVATWKQVGTISDTLSLNRDYEQTTETSVDATSSTDGDAGISTQELQSLDIQNVDDSKLRAINKALAENLAEIKSEPTISFADQTLAAGDDTTVTLSFPTRVGQVPDDVLALVGGDLSTEGAEGAPIWSTTDGINWTATFTASSAINNTSLRYEPVLDDEGVQVMDANGDPKLAVIPTVDADGNPTGAYESVGLDDLRQVSLVEALVNRVTDASDTVKAFASEQGATPATLPSVQDFADMSVEGVADDNLSAVQDALSTVRDRFEGEGDLFTQIETVVDSYNAVFDTVYAADEQPSATDLIEDLNNIGVSNLSSDVSRATDQTTLLQGALREIAGSKADITNEDSSVTSAAEQQAEMINSVEKLESFVTSVEKVLARANGETEDVDGAATPVTVRDEDLTALGFGDLLQDESANSRLSALQKVLLDQSEGEGSNAIVNYADLKAVLTTASDAFDAIVGLTATAQDDTYETLEGHTAAVTAALAEVDADSFQNMGIDGVTDVNIGSMTGDEMAAAVKDALANTPNDIVSLEAIQAVVDSYSDILATAQDDAGTIEVADLTNIGVTLAAGTEEAVAELASGIIATFGTADVSSVSDVQAKVDAINSVFANTLRTSDTDETNTTVVSKEELHTLGFSGATDDNLDAIQRVLSDQSDESDVKSYADLKQLIDNAVTAHTDILSAATTDDLTDIDTTDYTNMGIDGVSGDLSDGDTDNDGNLAAINDALINTDNSLSTAESVQEVVDSYNTILETATNDSGTIASDDLTNIGVELESGTEAAVAELASGVIASLGYSEVDTVAETQAIVDAIDAVFANTLRTSDDDATHTTVVSKDQLHTLGFVGATDDNLDAIQRVLSDQTDESDVEDYADLKQLIDDAITAHSDILNAASTDNLTGIDTTDYTNMGIDGVDSDNLSSINDALINTTNTLDTAASIQEVVDSYNHILDLRADGSGITLDAADFTDLGVTLKADNANQAEQLAYLQEIVANGLGSGDITTVSGLQALANATSDLIDLIQGNSPDSDGTDGLTIEQWALLGVTAADAEEMAMLNARLALTEDDLSDVTNLATDLAARVQESRNALAKIKAYANADGASDFDQDTVLATSDVDDVPTVQDYSFIGVVDYDAGNSTRVAIDATNIATINELFAAALVGADDGDEPASTRTEVQAVIDGAADRLGAFAKIVAYAEANVLTPADSSLIPTAADFALCGATGVADDNNIPALLTKLAAMGSSSNGLAVDTTPELQAFVKMVAIEKIKAWTNTDGTNGAAPILQDYLNADLVSYDDSAITDAMVPALNELFAGSLTNSGDADDQAEQQLVIDGAAAMLAAMAKIANYAEADGVIDLDGDADTGDANGYDQLTVADFEAAGISGVADGTYLSVGTGTSTSASGYNNLQAVLDKLADSGIKYINADTLDEVQALVADVAAEKIAYYADQDGQWPAVSESYTLYTDARASGGGDAFFFTGIGEAPTLDLKPGTYTFDLSQASMDGTDLTFSINAGGTGGLPEGVTFVTTGTAGQAGASAVLTVPQGYEGTLHYSDNNIMATGGTAVAEKLYFAPEVQDYTNAGLVDPNDNAITAQHLPFVNAIFAKDTVGHTDDAPNNLFDADDATSQQAAIDAYGANMLSLMKFVDYMLSENGVVKADFTLADFTNAGLLRVTGSSMSGVLDRLPGYEALDTLDREALNSVDKIQAFISRAIIAEYNADQANQAPVGADYVDAGISGADGDNYAAMNYQVATNGSYADTIAGIEALVTHAEAAINKLAIFDLDHIDPISNDSQIVIGRSHDGTNFVAQTLTLADFGDYADPSSDALASIKITALPAAGTLKLDGSAVSLNDSISVADINDGKLTYTPVTTNGATSFDFKVIDADSNESASDYTLSIDREDFSPAVGIANSGLVQADTGVYSGGLYVNDALTGFDGMSSLRVVISATGGDVKIGSLNGTTQITTGFDYATTGGDEICIEGTQAQINAALKTLQTKITSGNEKVDISIDVQPGGMVYNPENGHYYKVYSEGSKTWSQAKAAAETKVFEGMTGYLVTITSAEENAFIASKVAADSWLGGSDAAEDGVWRWVTGPEGEADGGAGTIFYLDPDTETVSVQPGYDNFNTGEPNGHNGGESYSQMYVSSGRWNDLSGSATQSAYVVEFGGYSSDISTVKSGIRTLTVYATEALGNVSMTLSDFEQAGVTGVTADNLASINQVLSGKSAADVDTNPELQSVVDGVITAIAKIEDFNNGANGVTTLDVADYEAAGIVGVLAGNKDAVNSAIQALNAGGANTTAEIQAAVAQVRIETYADATDATGLEVPTVADYHALGIYAVDASNLAWVNSFSLDAAADLADNTAEIELLVQEALEMKPYFDAVAKISAYADSDGNGTVPTLEDYVAAQLTGINEYNLGMANALFAASTVGTGDTTPAGTQSEQQAVINAASAELSSYAKIVSYAANNAGEIPTATDYSNIGLAAFPSEYVAKLNALLLTQPIGRAEVDELSEIEALASRIKITEYANVNGFAVDGTTALTGDYVPSITDYENLGITQIFNGTQMVDIDANNLEQVNDVMRMRYVGDGARIDVIDNATDAASNETNLTYAGSVATAADIEASIRLAMGETVDSGNSSFGLRAAALDKIAAFAETVSNLANQAAYDAYVADSGNAGSIPSADDYNDAGVLGITNSTDEINESLAAAINTKLFTGGADGTVNTAVELQPFVDSANEIVNKIAAWAEPDWSGVGVSESYISLLPKFANANFEEGSGSNIPGWVPVLSAIDLGVTEIAGWTSPQDPVAGYGNRGTTDFGPESSVDWTSRINQRSMSVTLVDNADASHGSTLVLDTGGLNGTAQENYIYHGPAVYSEGTVNLKAGASVAIDFQAIQAGDRADVYGYLLEVNTGNHIDLMDWNYQDGVNDSWQTKSVTLTAGQDGEYRFVFVGGSHNGDHGSAGGGKFVIDNILVDAPPEKFNGVVNSNGADDWEKAQSVFDGKSTVDDANALAFTSNAAATADAPVSLGWYDEGDFGFDAAVADKLVIHPKNTTGGFNDLPADFDVYGWDNNSGSWELIKSFDLADTTGIVSTDGKALEYDLSDGVAKAYTGFKIEVRETFGGGVVEITEMDFQARKVTLADLPSGSEPTYQDYNAIGFTEVDANNVADINALVFAKESAADVSTLPQIKSVIDTYLDAMGRIEAFANGDGAADSDGDFTSDTGETGVPTVADYQAIGMRFVVNSDGLNVPISDDNIAAINEVIAGASYGDDSGDTAITTAAELRAVLNSDNIAARLAAIAKISELATVAPNSVTFLDHATTPTVGDAETVNLTLTGPYGSAQVLTATMTTEGGWSGIAAELAEGLDANSGFVITAEAGGLTISRADGATFSVAANDGPGDWSLSDGGSNTLSLASGTAAGTLTVTGTGTAPSVADFTAAGVTNVTANNIAIVVDKIVSASAQTEFDTQTELEAIVSGANAKIAAWADSDGTGDAPTLGDYSLAQITGVNAYNVGMANSLFAASDVGTGHATLASTQSEQQAVIDGAADKLAAFSRIVSYGVNDGGTVPTASDFDLIGVVGVAGPGGDIDVYSNIDAVNQAVYDVASNWRPSTVAEVQALVNPPIFLEQLRQYQINGDTVYQTVGDAFNYTTGPRDSYGGLNSANFLDGIVQGTWTEQNSGGNEAQYHFDISSGGDDGRYVDYWNIVADKPAIIGWQDTAGFYADAKILTELRLHHRDSGWNGAPGRMPSTFDVEGFNSVTGEWELIKHFEKEPLRDTSGTIIPVTTRASLSQLPDYQTYQIDATRPYDGYRLVVTENIEVAGGSTVLYPDDGGAGTMMGIDEIQFMAKSLTSLVLKPDLSVYQSAGITDVTEETVNAMNYLVNQGYKAATEVTEGTASAAEVQSIDASDINLDGHQFSLLVGGTELSTSAELSTGASLADLVTALQTDSAYAAAPFTLAVNGDAIEVTWKAVGVVADTAILSQNEFTSVSGVHSVVSEAIAIQQASFTTIDTYAANNSATRPSVLDYELAGFDGVNAINLFAVNRAATVAGGLTDYATAKTVVTQGLTDHADAISQIDAFVDAGTPIPTAETYLIAGINSVEGHYVDLMNALLASSYSSGDLDTFAKLSGVVATEIAPINTYLADVYSRLEPTTTDTETEQTPYEVALAKVYEVVLQSVGDDASAIGLTASELNLVYPGAAATSSNLASLVARLQGQSELPFSGDQMQGVLENSAYIDYLKVQANGSLNGLASYAVRESGERQIEGQSMVDFVRINLVDAQAGDVVKLYNDTTLLSTMTVTSTHVSNGYLDTASLNLSTGAPATGHATLSVVVERSSAVVSTTEDWHFTYGTSAADALTLIKNAAENDTADAYYPSIGDYTVAGVTGVAKWNLSAINDALNSANVDSAALASSSDVQAIVDAVNRILDPVDRATDATEADFETIGLLNAVDNSAVVTKLLEVIGSRTADEINSREELAVDLIEAYNRGNGSDVVPLSIDTSVDLYTLAGITGVTAGNLAAVNALILAEADNGAATKEKIQAIVDKVLALAVIEAYAGNTALAAPTPATYQTAGLATYDSQSGSPVTITSDNIAAVNELIVAQGATFTEVGLQTLLDTAANVSRLNAIAKIAAYAEDIANPAPSVPDYAALGITVTAGDLATANSNVDAVAGSGADTLAEISALMPAPARFVEVSALSLVDSDSNTANGVERTSQVLTAHLGSTLEPTDTVLLSVNGGTPIDVTGSVINNQLEYGHDKATITLTKHSNPNWEAVPGFSSYLLFLVDETFTGVPTDGSSGSSGMLGAKELWIPDNSLLRGNSEFTYVSAPSIATAALSGTDDVVLVSNGSNIQSTDTVVAHLMLDLTASGSGTTRTYSTTDLSFTITNENNTLTFVSHSDPVSGTDFYVEIEYIGSDNQPLPGVPDEKISITASDSFTPTLPANASKFNIIGIGVEIEMASTQSGTYEATLPGSYLNDIDTQFTPVAVEVVGDDDIVYAKDYSLVGAINDIQVGGIDFGAINQLTDGTTFTVAAQVTNVDPDQSLRIASDVLSPSPRLTALTKGVLVVSEDDELVITVKDSGNADITSVATSGDNSLDVHLSNKVDFLGFDINSDGDYLDDYEIAINGVVGDSATDDATGQLWLDVTDAADGDLIEVLADGNVIYTHNVTQSEIDTGKINTGDINLNVSDDITGANGNTGVEDDDKVNLEIRVNYTDANTNDQANVTWEYQW